MTTKRKTKPKKKSASKEVRGATVINVADWATFVALQNKNKPGLSFWPSTVGEGGWHWHIKAKNGRIVADGAEGYSSEAKARQGFRAAARLAAKALSELEGK